MTDKHDDTPLQGYQDDLDTHGVDWATHDMTDDPTKELGVSPSEFKKELSHLDGEVTGDENPEFEEDMREQIEGMNDNDTDRG